MIAGISTFVTFGLFYWLAVKFMAPDEYESDGESYPSWTDVVLRLVGGLGAFCIMLLQLSAWIKT